MEAKNFGQLLSTVLRLDSMKKTVQKELMELDMYGDMITENVIKKDFAKVK